MGRATVGAVYWPFEKRYACCLGVDRRGVRSLMPPLVSVCIPTYNRGALLCEAVQSVLAQSYRELDIIIADDGSTDGSVGALPADARMRRLRLPHTGNVGRIRQAALEAADGEFVAFLDSDDRWRLDKLARQVDRLSVEPEAAWCFGGYILIDADGQPTPLRWGTPTMTGGGDLLAALIEQRAGIALQTVLVRRERALAVGFDARVPLCEDLDFLIRLAAIGRACAVAGIVAEIREHPGRSTRTRYGHLAALAWAYWRYQRLTADPTIRRASRRRAYRYTREYLAAVRAACRVHRV